MFRTTFPFVALSLLIAGFGSPAAAQDGEEPLLVPVESANSPSTPPPYPGPTTATAPSPGPVAQDSPPVVEDPPTETRLRWGLLIGGALMVAVPYIITVLVASGLSDVGTDVPGQLYVPVVGPFLSLGDTEESITATALVIDGVIQSVGVVLLIIGLIPVEDDRYGDAPKRSEFALFPLIDQNTAGLGVRGAF
ncbi:MAG: hypothetical protein KC416_15125 [Myxococcales bacterium]|nr:hypothetical protein [Myxococcales bacterium]